MHSAGVAARRIPGFKHLKEPADWSAWLLSAFDPRDRRTVQPEVGGHLVLVPAERFPNCFGVDPAFHAESVQNALLPVKAKRTLILCILHDMDTYAEDDLRPDYAKRLARARLERGFATPKEACARFGWKYDTYIQHERGERGIGRKAEEYARAYHVSEAWLLTGEGEMRGGQVRVPIVGLVGAGPDGAVLFATGDSNFGETVNAKNVTGSTVALEVRGDSMRGYAEDGWIITYEEKQPPSPELYGEVLVVFLEDGRVLVKQLLPGSAPGFYHLASSNAPILLDQAVREVAEITNIVPRRAATRFIRRNPDASIQDTGLDGRKR